MEGKLRRKNIKGLVEQSERDLRLSCFLHPIYHQDQVLPVVGCPLKPGMILTFLSVLKINVTPGASSGPRRERAFSIAAAFLSFPTGKN